MQNIAINIKDIKKQYDETIALDGVSMSISKGEMFGLIGPDGAGKTTLIRILTTLLDADDGSAEILGIPVNTRPERVREIIGYMPQRFSLYQDLTVQENLRFFADLFNVSRTDRLKRTEELLNFSRLTPFVDRRAGQLSGGMKQKLALSCALIHTPQLLILDEPTTGVDPVSRREFWQILSRLKDRGVCILVSTPYMDEAARCDRVALIHKGHILTSGTEDDIALRFPGEVGAVYGSDLPRIAGWFKKHLQPDYVQLLGERVQINLPGGDRHMLDAFVSDARKEGLAIDHADIVKPGIEDTFIALIARTAHQSSFGENI